METGNDPAYEGRCPERPQHAANCVAFDCGVKALGGVGTEPSQEFRQFLVRQSRYGSFDDFKLAHSRFLA